MDRSRLLGVIAPFVPLLVAGFVAADSLPAVTNATGSNLDCTNDFEEQMFCQFKAQNCTHYWLTLRSNSGYGEHRGLFQPCDTGLCCCSALVGGKMLIYGDVVTATVWRDAQVTESKEVSIIDSFKPKAPTIVSVKEFSGNLQLKWRTNSLSYYVGTRLTANVTYHKKGSSEKVTKSVEPITVDGLRFYEIPGGDLEPSTTYVFSVRSYTGWSGRYSDSSRELEFTTGVSPRRVLLAVILGLSAFAVMVTAVMFGCYVKLKKKWWDTVASPKLLITLPSKIPIHPESLEPVISSVNILPRDQDDSKSCLQVLLTDISGGSAQQSSGICTGSSAVSYAKAEPDVRVGVQNALSELFPHLSPGSPAAICPLRDDSALCGLGALNTSSGSSGMDNRSYSLVVPGGSLPTPSGGPEAQTHAEMACVSAYHPSEGDAAPRAEQQAPAHLLIHLPLLASSLIPTDMSYRQYRPDSAYAEDSGLSSVSSSSDTVALCDPCCDEVDDGASQDQAAVCDDNPCYARVPAGPCIAPLVVDDYQAFPKVATQPEGSLGQIPPGIPGFPHSQCLPELHRPLISLMCSQIPVITNAGYQSV